MTDRTDAQAESRLFRLRSRTGVALITATVLASMVGFLDAYMINVAVPAIGSDLHADVSELQWVLTGYLVTVASLLLLAGALADHFGRRRLLDLTGALLAMLGLGGVIYALTAGPASGRGDTVVLASGAVGVVCLVGLVPVERRRPTPMLKTSLFRIRQFVAINAATVLFYGALAAASYLVVLQCELRLGYSATAAGAALIPESAVFLIVSPLVGGLVARVGTRGPMAAGIVIVAGGFSWLSAAQPGDTYVQAILPGAILWGLGIGLTVAPLTAGVLAAVDDSDLGEASAINDAASRVGGVIMIALVPALLGTGSSHDLVRPLAIVAAAITTLFVSHSRTPVEKLPAAAPRVHGCAVPTPTAGV